MSLFPMIQCFSLVPLRPAIAPTIALFRMHAAQEAPMQALAHGEVHYDPLLIRKFFQHFLPTRHQNIAGPLSQCVAAPRVAAIHGTAMSPLHVRCDPR